MRPIHGIFAAFAVGFAAAFATSALMNTVQLGVEARKQGAGDLDRTIAARTLALDRQQAALRAALARRPPALPPIPRVPAGRQQASQPPLVTQPLRSVAAVVPTRQAPVARTHSSPARHGDGEEQDD
jgi:hypothetical protein